MRSSQGVTLDKSRRGKDKKQYRARLSFRRGVLDLGRFKTQQEASQAYDQAVRTLKLLRGLNSPFTTTAEHYSEDVQQRVEAFVAKHPDLNLCELPPATVDVSMTASMYGTGVWMPNTAGYDMLAGAQHEQAGFLLVPASEMNTMAAAGQQPGNLPILPLQTQLQQHAPVTAGAAAGVLAPEQQHAPSSAAMLAPEAFMSLDPELFWPAQEAAPFDTAPAAMQQALHTGADAADMAAVLAGFLSEDDTETATGAPMPGALSAQLRLQEQQQSSTQTASTKMGGAASPAVSAAAGSPAAPALQQVPSSSQQTQSVAADGFGAPWLAWAMAQGMDSLGTGQDVGVTMTCGEVVLFADVTIQHLLQLYTNLMAVQRQRAGMAAIAWMVGVRSSLSAGGASDSGAASSAGLPACVVSAVLRTCASLVATGATSGQDGESPRQPFCWSFLVSVLEQVAAALMALRTLCAMSYPMQPLSNTMLQTWRAQMGTQMNEAASEVLSWLVCA